MRVLSQNRSIAALHFQKQLWLLQRLTPEVAVANISSRLDWTGPLDFEILTESVNDYVNRHSYLQCRIDASDTNQLVQNGDAKGPVQFRYFDLRYLAESNRTAETQRRMEVAAKTPLPLNSVPPLRCDVFRTDEQHYQIVTVFNHMVCDGLSMGILCKELLQAYEARVTGQLPQWRELPQNDFEEFSINQLDRGPITPAAKTVDRPPHFALPYSRTTNGPSKYRGDKITFSLDQQQSNWINDFSRQHETSPFATWLSLINIVIGDYSNDSEFQFDIVKSGRSRQELRLVGPFFETVCIDLSLDRNLTFEQQLVANQVKVNSLNAAEPHTLPASDARSRVLIDYQSLLQTVKLPGGVSVIPSELDNGAATAELCIGIRRDRKRYEGHIKFDIDLFDAPAVQRIIDRLFTAIEAVQNAPSSAIKNLSLQSDSEKQILADFDRTSPAKPLETIDQQILQQATRDPQAIAIESSTGKRTWNELSQRISSVASGLLGLGVANGDRVGLLLPKCPDAVAAIVGIMNCGAVYVPLDADSPATRRQAVIDQACVKLIITSESYAHLIEGQYQTVLLDQLLESESELALKVTSPEPEHSAYSIFTSGSTGMPKGVEISHSNLTNFCAGMDDLISPNEGTWLAATNWTFDISILELLWTLARGIKVVISTPSEILADFALLMTKHQITHFQTVPSMLQLLLSNQNNCSAIGNLDVLLVGGEPLTDTMCKTLTRLSRGHVFNMYGPTETTIWSTAWALNNHSDVRIGKPLKNQSVFILNNELQPMPVGAVGELHIGGAGVAKGYCNDPAETKSRFVDHSQFGRIYRTGDQAKIHEDGSLQFVGRLDNQVKIGGHRFELGDVDVTVQLLKGVEQCVAFISANQVLEIAYTCDHDNLVPPSSIQQNAHSLLASHMVPKRWHRLESLPLNSAGKIDRAAVKKIVAALASHPQSETRQTVETAPEETTFAAQTTRLRSVIETELNLDSLPMDVPWTQLDISSIDTLGLVLKFEKELGLSFPVSQVFAGATVRATLEGLISTSTTKSEPETPADPISNADNTEIVLPEMVDEFEEGVI